jgi:hypothetical protein
MATLTLADALINNASKFLGCYEDPKTPNRSGCIDEIQTIFDPKRVDKGEAYCAKFVSNILNMTFPFFLKLPPNIGDASTRALRAKAIKNKIPILDVPRKGAVFFYYTATGGHVGFVESALLEKGKVVGFRTIEGNATATINGKKREGVVQINRLLKDKDYQFIDYPSLSDLRIPTAKTVFDIALITAGCIGAFYTYQKFGHDSKLYLKQKMKKLG